MQRRRRFDPNIFHKVEHYAFKAAGTIIILAWVVKHVIEDLVRLFK